MSRCYGFHRFFEFLELNKKKESSNGNPTSAGSEVLRSLCKVLGSLLVGTRARATWGSISISQDWKSEIHRLGQAGPRRRLKKCRKVPKIDFRGFGNSATSVVLPVWRGWFPSVPRALGDPFPSFFSSVR